MEVVTFPLYLGRVGLAERRKTGEESQAWWATLVGSAPWVLSRGSLEKREWGA